ncbi:glycosyltransferase [Rugosimonospora africana]|uniref:glycosyltransferase n=1 Tax=Rugosimonospora africana TaxID=556532 RepID=UPI001940C3D4|nr:nucleotide disphospho-sugar-binding domain-containing protein [Rugosimonospora africana]
MREYRDSHAFSIVLVDRHNSEPNLADVAVPVFVLERSAGFMNTPASQVFQRVYGLLGECLDIAREFDPDLVLYDFCALEGAFVAQILNRPRWCSVPGLMGPLTDRGYLTDAVSSEANQDAIASIQRHFDIAVPREGIELISNSLFVPGDLNLLWSYPSLTPHNFRDNRGPARYQFAGYLSDGHRRRTAGGGTPVVYLSFGTEVMVNMWTAQEETREGVRRCVAGLAQRWRDRDFEVVFATQGNLVLPEYPANWRVHGKVDQQEVLSRADVFVTHGGSNSFHEAVLSRVPMVVAPFFGDQILIGNRVEELGVGIHLAEDDGIDTGKSKHFLNDGLTERIDHAVAEILDNDGYRKNFDTIRLECTPALAELD